MNTFTLLHGSDQIVKFLISLLGMTIMTTAGVSIALRWKQWPRNGHAKTAQTVL